MNEWEVRRWMRKTFSKHGWALLIYYLLMSATVTCACLAEALFAVSFDILSGNWARVFLNFLPAFSNAVATNGWGYILAIVIGAGIMFLWKGKSFCIREIWHCNKSLTPSNFAGFLLLMVATQAVFQMIAILMNWLFSLFGISVLGSVNAATGIGDTLSMFLYGCIFGPIGEEILFRGLMMRSFQPFGKKFAVFASAFLFAIFHGNIVQTPFAFLAGCILGFVAMEYSLLWAMILHIFNNLVLGDILPRLLDFLPDLIGTLIFQILIWGCAAASLVFLWIRRDAISAYIRRGKIHPWPMKSFFSAAGILVMIAIFIMETIFAFF